jgi:plastocyanin
MRLTSPLAGLRVFVIGVHMRRTLWLILALTVLAGVSGGGAAPVGKRIDVTILNGRFTPAAINIAIGDTVQWTNLDNADHQVVADDSSFASGKLKKGERFSRTFGAAGKLGFSCVLHPREKGTITIK